MSRISLRAVSRAGNALFVGGLVLFLWGATHFADLTNVRRLALLLPLAYSLPMTYVDTFANWQSATLTDRIRACGWLCAAVLLTIGVLVWLVLAPDAREI